MKPNNAEIETRATYRSGYVQGLGFIATLVFATHFRLTYPEQSGFHASQFTHSLGLSAVNFILVVTYFQTYKFFADKFYFFISVMWAAEAIYLMLDLNGSPDLKYKFVIYLLSLTSDIVLLVPLFYRESRALTRMKLVVIGTAVAGLTCFGVAYAVINYLPETRQPDMAKWLLVGPAISFGLLCTTGAILNDRLGGNKVGWTGKILLSTFYAYGLLQFFYPFTIIPKLLEPSWISSLYIIAQVVKVGNAVAMQGILQMALVNARYEVREAELQATEAKLEGENQLIELGALTASIKHDINTPLATMGFDIEALKDICQHDKRIGKKLGRLEESMERIYAITKVVDIIRGDRSFFARDQYMNKANMLEIVNRAVRAVKNEIGVLKQKDAKIIIKVEGRDVYVRAYTPMFERVIVNVVKNGLEAIEEAGRERGIIRINVRATEGDAQIYPRWVKVEIEDNGVGIPEENWDKLATLKFTSKSHKKPNSGIGLFISKRIVDIHSGRISFNSKVGTGTRVTILLPEWNALQKIEQRDYENSQEREPESLGVEAAGDGSPETK